MELVAQLRLPDEDDLQLTRATIQVRQNPDLFEQRDRQVLCFVDEDDGKRVQWRKGIEELVQEVAQFRARGLAQPTCRQIRGGDNAEIDEHDFQQILARDERVGYKRAECLAIKVFQHRAAQRRL